MSRLPFELLLALRYLRPKRTFVSVITLISIIGVMLGVAVLIIVISVMTGFDKELRDKFFGFNAHMTVMSYSRKPVADYRQWMEIIRQNPRVRAVAPFVVQQAFIETQPDSGESAYGAPYLKGIDPGMESEISILPESVVVGDYNLRGNRILVGATLAENLGIGVGDHLSIYSPRDLRQLKAARSDEDADAVLPEDYEVAGIFDVGYFEYNTAFIIASVVSAQELYGLGDSVTALSVMLHNPYQAEMARRELGSAIGGDVYISTWLEDPLLRAVVVEKNVMFYILFFIMIVAAFGITSAQITFVVQKTREIGMLKALGATSLQIMCVFLGQSLLVGVLGVLMGLGGGLLALHYRNEFLHVMNKLFGFELFPRQIYMFSELPALVIPQDVAIICGGSLLICLLAGLLPALNAARLHPVEALRHE